MQLSVKKLLIVAFAVAVCFRLAFYFYALEKLPPSSDEAWPSLMANHVLKKEFPVVYWGQSYMGTQESYFQALLIPFFGLKIWVMRLYPLAFGILFVWVSYLLAKRVYGEEAGLITVALLAIPVPYLTLGSIMIPPDNYLATTTLGSVSLVLLTDIVFGDPRNKMKHFAWLGFVLGFTFWLHILSISYIGVALLFIFLRDKLFFTKMRFWAMVLWFIVGSFPLIWYNAAHGFATFEDVGRQTGWSGTFFTLKAFFLVTIQYLIGMKVMLYGDNAAHVGLPALVQWGLAGLWAAVAALVLVLRFGEMLRLARFSVKNSGGTWMLIALACATLVAFARSARSAPDDVRYVLPMMSVLPILFAFGLSWLFQKARYGGAVVLALVLGTHLWGNILLAKEWNKPDVVQRKLELPDTRPLLGFLKEHDINHAYAHFWVSYRITLETQEKLICSEPYNERFPGNAVKFIDEVRAAANVAYICHPTMYPPDEFAERFKDAGGTCRKETVGDFTVFYDFVPPCGKTVLRELPRGPWLVTASTNQPAVRRMLDGNTSTAWATGSEQAPGMWLSVDLGATQDVCKIRIDLGKSRDDYPRKYVVEASLEGQEWKEAHSGIEVGGELFWEGSHPRYMVKDDWFNAVFPSVKARHIRIKLTGGHEQCWWTIAELRMFGPE